MHPHEYQGSDYSCGAATLRMLLFEAGGDAPDEAALMDELNVDLNGTHVDALVAAVVRRGFPHLEWQGDVALADVQDLLQDHAVMVGYQAPALRMGHFALVEAVTDTEVVLDDPWFGPNTRMDAQDFVAAWRAEPPGGTPRHRWTLAVRRLR